MIDWISPKTTSGFPDLCAATFGIFVLEAFEFGAGTLLTMNPLPPGLPNAMAVNARHAYVRAFKLVVDGALTVAVLLLLAFTLTGLAMHEWLGVALIAPLLLHLLLNWGWVVATLRRFFSTLPSLVRLNALLNLALFVTMTVAVASGLLISAVALPFFGLLMYRTTFLLIVHFVSADVLLLIVGLHLGMNWKWVSSVIRRQILQPLRMRIMRNVIQFTAIGRLRRVDMNGRRQLLNNVKRELGRSLIILVAAGTVAFGLYGLSQSALASPLANAMDVSSPLIMLDGLVRGRPGEANRGRYAGVTLPGLSHAAGDLVILASLVSTVVLIRQLAQRRRRNVRGRGRTSIAAGISNPAEAGGPDLHIGAG